MVDQVDYNMSGHVALLIRKIHEGEHQHLNVFILSGLSIFTSNFPLIVLIQRSQIMLRDLFF